MKICAIICEFNPFHNGHAYLLSEARRLSGCDALVCIMSGQFTQRGEICRTDKFLRAKHAVLCGADAVVELPAPFAVAPAEIFAAGGVKQAALIKGEVALAFGCESGDKADFLEAAEILLDESEGFKTVLQSELDRGESYIKAYSAAFEACGGKSGLLAAPNNVLGVEYAKAILRINNGIKILPIKRVGADFNDGNLRENFSSATAIRSNAKSELVRQNMPECSYVDFMASTDNILRFERFAADVLFTCDKNNLKRVYGCTEGLENKLKACSVGNTYKNIVDECTSKRYSSSRIKRILCANMLGLYADEVAEFLNEDLPIKILAVRKDKKDEILPILTGGKSAESRCFELTKRAYELWRHLSSPTIFENVNEKMILV